MSLTLRILCVVGSALTFFGIAKQIKSAKIKIEDSLFWVLFSGLLLLIAVFPQIAFTISRLLGFMAASNFVFLAVIAALLFKEFRNTAQISRLKHHLNELAQEQALEHASEPAEGEEYKN